MRISGVVNEKKIEATSNLTQPNATTEKQGGGTQKEKIEQNDGSTESFAKKHALQQRCVDGYHTC